MNTPLLNPDFSSVIPAANAIATPNTVLTTPFRSQRSDGTPLNTSFNTPASLRTQNGTLAPTPVRDKLSINPDDGLDGSETPAVQKQVKEQLRAGLSTLPAPRNDYEIVVPEDETKEDGTEVPVDDVVEDQADIDARKQQEILEQSKLIFFYYFFSFSIFLVEKNSHF